MTDTSDYAPSPVVGVQQQVTVYEATHGQKANTFRGRLIVVMTSRGARTGKLRKTPIMRIERDGVYAAVASNAARPEHPNWYVNLLANPHVLLQDGAIRTERLARELIDHDELATWWALADAAYPLFPLYRAQTSRTIPIFVLEPSAP